MAPPWHGHQAALPPCCVGAENFVPPAGLRQRPYRGGRASGIA
ncbi:hypothetical protein VB712_17610 [Spirulina sp. CCNP1310]|nr:hypothetical protein [Spirulina sp. CCNP1310]MEA5421046.1 hypothetical protein [Spirulina sp. CCNP1310]